MEQNAMTAPAQLGQAEAARGRILIVEDDLDAMNLLTVLLKQNGFEVYGAGDGTQGLNVAVREQPDLIILDIGLPAGNGIFVLENIRRNASLFQTPVIVWSGAPAFRPSEAIDAGASCFLPKPCSNESILHAVEAAMLTVEHLKAQVQQPQGQPAGQPQQLPPAPQREMTPFS